MTNAGGWTKRVAKDEWGRDAVSWHLEVDVPGDRTRVADHGHCVAWDVAVAATPMPSTVTLTAYGELFPTDGDRTLNIDGAKELAAFWYRRLRGLAKDSA